jgi:hypothetical protein
MDTASDTASVFATFFLAILLIGNLVLLAVAWQDQSWTALGLLAFGSPSFNGALLAIGLLAIPFRRRDPTQFSLGRHLALTVAAPLAAVAVDAAVILSMDLHGH